MTGPYADWADRYIAAGWPGVLPVGNRPGQKSPPPKGYTGENGAIPTAAEVADWKATRGDRNIVIRLPRGYVGIDVDAYPKDGIESPAWAIFKLIELIHGELPTTAISTSRDDGQSGIRIYRLPTEMTFYHDEVGAPGDPNGLDGTTRIDIIQWRHRFVVVCPSIHPDTGKPYRWPLPNGEAMNRPPRAELIPLLPQPWIDHLERTCDCFTTGTAAEGEEQRPKYPTCADAAAAAITALEAGGSRHNAVRGATMRLVWGTARGEPGAAADLERVHRAFLESVTKPGDGQRGADEADREWERLTTKGKAAAAGQGQQPWQTGPTLNLAGNPARSPPANDSTALNLPATFWETRPVLGRIRDAAWSRQRAPDAVFAGVLTRATAALPHTLAIPPIVGTPAGTGILAAVVSASGVGKSTGASLAVELTTTGKIEVKTITGGTGEGMVEAYFDMVEILDPTTNKPKRVRMQAFKNLHIYIDEISKMLSVAKRDGATIFEMFRQAFSGSALGEHNASAERRRTIDRGNYSIGVLVAAQPHVLGPLFADVDAGTPSRFLYLSGTDPNIPESPPPWPGQIDIGVPDHWNMKLSSGGLIRLGPWEHFVIVADEIAAEIRARDLVKVHGRGDGDAWNGHRDLVRLKVAFVLAILDRRVDVRVSDWELAGVVVDTSDAVRRHAQSVIDSFEVRRQAASDDRQARRAVVVHGRVEDAEIERIARRVTRKVVASPGEMTRGTVKNWLGPAGRDSGEDAIDLAVSKGWVEERIEPGQGAAKERLFPGAVPMPK